MNRPTRSCGMPAALVAGVCLVLALAVPSRALADDAQVRDDLTRQLERIVRESDEPSLEPTLLALRALRDERLRPLFAHLTTRTAPASRVHGWLGLAELSPSGTLNVELVRSAPEPEVRAMALGAAVRQELMGESELRRTLEWPDLEPSLRLLLTSRLMQATGALDRGQVSDALAELDDTKVGLRLFAELLLAHDVRERDPRPAWKIVEDVGPLGYEPLVRVALGYVRSESLDSVGGFVERAIEGAEDGSALELEGVGTLLGIEPDTGAEHWRRVFSRADRLATQIRASLVLLHRASYAPPSVFSTLEDEDEILGAIGRAGRSIAERADPAPVIELMEIGHGPSIAAAFSAMDGIDGEEGAAYLASLVGAWIERLEDDGVPTALFESARVLANRDPAKMRPLIDAAVARDRALVCQALLLALVEAPRGDGGVVEASRAWPDRKCGTLAALASARTGEELGEEQHEFLRSGALGGEGFPAPLKGLAAWLALREMGEDGSALAQALASDSSPGAWR